MNFYISRRKSYTIGIDKYMGMWKRAEKLISYFFVFLLFVSIILGQKYFNLIVTGVVGFFAMMIGVLIARRSEDISPKVKSVTYGISSGLMISSAFIILAPKAISVQSSNIGSIGGVGIAIGYIIGHLLHEISHALSHHDKINKRLYSIKVAQITLHSIFAGFLLGITYTSIPNMSILFGFSVVAHKLPAGMTTSLASKNRKYLMLIPASTVGICGVLIAILYPVDITGALGSLIFGLSTGLFIHIAIDMIPECVGSNSSAGHGKIVCSTGRDKIRLISAFSVLLGLLIITIPWIFLNIYI